MGDGDKRVAVMGTGGRDFFPPEVVAQQLEDLAARVRSGLVHPASYGHYPATDTVFGLLTIAYERAAPKLTSEALLGLVVGAALSRQERTHAAQEDAIRERWQLVTGQPWPDEASFNHSQLVSSLDGMRASLGVVPVGDTNVYVCLPDDPLSGVKAPLPGGYRLLGWTARTGPAGCRGLATPADLGQLLLEHRSSEEKDG